MSRGGGGEYLAARLYGYGVRGARAQGLAGTTRLRRGGTEVLAAAAARGGGAPPPELDRAPRLEDLEHLAGQEWDLEDLRFRPRAPLRRVQSLWYRAPELLLGERTYSSAIDLWSSGCIFSEMLLRRPVFEGRAELHQLGLIFGLVGLPDEESWPGCSQLSNWKATESFKEIFEPGWRELFAFPPEGALSELGLVLLQGLLECCPERRLAAAAAVEHPYFQEAPQPQEPGMLPTFKEGHRVMCHFQLLARHRCVASERAELALVRAMVVSVGPELQWADEVVCEKVDGKAQDLAGEAEVICLLNESRVRNAKYDVPHYVVEGYYHDDGPPALDQIVEACRLIHEKLQAKKKVLVIAPAGTEYKSHRHFSGLCTAAYPLLMQLSAALGLGRWSFCKPLAHIGPGGSDAHLGS
ncbi:unnamed protein product [Durusdinium trenchii]|uniref:Cyclin-dependent kinase 2 homolog n=1 Tax=Durusdinium trenchii TaxID=1381693 RepID=A0ABP0RBH7_9DINO